MKRTFCVLSIFLYSTVAIFAQVKPSVSVIGEAEMMIAPDQVQFTFEIVATDKALATAKIANDRAASRTLAAAKASVSIVEFYHPSENYSFGLKTPMIGYDIRRMISGKINAGGRQNTNATTKAPVMSLAPQAEQSAPVAAK